MCQPRTKCGGGGAARPKNGGQNMCRLGGDTTVGDPVGIADGQSYFSWVDFSLDTSAGRFEFQRSYTSNDDFWGLAGDVVGIARPFGPSWTRPDASGVASANWSHSLFSFVLDRPGAAGRPNVWTVRRWDGSILTFDACAPTSGCFAVPRDEALEADAKLYQAGNVFTLYDGGRRYLFGHNVGSRWFLTAIHTDQWSGTSTAPIVSSITYATPANCSSGPWLQYVNLGDARQLKFEYSIQAGGTGCALWRVRLRQDPSSTTWLDLVSYDYTSSKAGRVEGVYFANGASQGFSYPPLQSPTNGEFKVLRNLAPWLKHVFVAGRVQSVWEATDGTSLKLTWSLGASSSASCPPNTSCLTARQFALTAQRYSGTGSGGMTSRSHAATMVDVGWSTAPRTSGWTEAGNATNWTWKELNPPNGAPAGAGKSLVPEYVIDPIGESFYIWSTPSAFPASRQLDAVFDPERSPHWWTSWA